MHCFGLAHDERNRSYLTPRVSVYVAMQRARVQIVVGSSVAVKLSSVMVKEKAEPIHVLDRPQ
jgi:hypothetical protein